MLIDHVNILQGTASTADLSYGNTLPLVARPWGMTHWTLQTAEGRWLFHPDHPRLQGVRATHQPSPWIGDYGAVSFLPQTGRLLSTATQRSSSYKVNALRPDVLDVRLRAYGTNLRLTPTVRGAVMEIDFPGAAEQRLIIDPVGGLSWAQVVGDREIVGYTRGNSGGVPEGFASYYVVRFDTPFSTTACGGLSGGDIKSPPHANPPHAAMLSKEQERVGVFVEFSSLARRVTARIAFSFISIDQARENLRRELSGDFKSTQKETANAWEETLGRIVIDEPGEQRRRTFYSCLYRTALFPRVFHEIDASGATVHYSPYDGQVHPGPMYTDNGFWDTYRTLYPLLALIDRPRFAEMMAGFLNACKEGGWLPQWCSPGYRQCMIGTHSDAVLATAAAADLPGFDVRLAYEAAVKNADLPPSAGTFGRASLEDYIRLGYVPASGYHAASATLDFAYDDWCVAQLARAAGHDEDAERLLQRSQNYRNVFDPRTRFVRNKDAAGKFIEPFDEFEWGKAYVEGGPWQLSWAVPHDPAGLIELYGGAAKFVARLEQMLATPPTFRIGDYPHEIHEMTEMALAASGAPVGFGQYAHSNQPVHHVLYLFAAAGRADLTRHWTRRVMLELYNDGVKGFPGDEDNGEMAAWYVLNAIGLFPLCPGDGKYWLGSPPSDVQLRSNGEPAIDIVRGENRQPWVSHRDLLQRRRIAIPG